MNHKRLGIALLTSLLALGCVVPSAFAWDNGHDRDGWSRDRDGGDRPRDGREGPRREWRDDRRRDDRGYREAYREPRGRDRDYGYYRPAPPPYWSRGQRYHGPVYVVDDYRRYDLRRPPRGYRWQCDDTGNWLMVAIATGVIADIVLNH